MSCALPLPLPERKRKGARDGSPQHSAPGGLPPPELGPKGRAEMKGPQEGGNLRSRRLPQTEQYWGGSVHACPSLPPSRWTTSQRDEGRRCRCPKKTAQRVTNCALFFGEATGTDPPRSGRVDSPKKTSAPHSPEPSGEVQERAKWTPPPGVPRTRSRGAPPATAGYCKEERQQQKKCLSCPPGHLWKP